MPKKSVTTTPAETPAVSNSIADLLSLAEKAPVYTRKRASRSKFDAHIPVIDSLLSKNYTAKGVVDFLAANGGPKLGAQAFYVWNKARKNRAAETAGKE